MNFRMMGIMLIACAVLAGAGGLLAGTIANKSAGITEQAGWAVGCFRGDWESCRQNREHDQMVERWQDRGIQIAIGSGFLLIIGLTLLAGSVIRPSSPSEKIPEEEAELTPDELAEAEEIKRELVLRGARFD